MSIPTLLTLRETAAILKVSYYRAAQLAREQIVPVVSLGRTYRIDPQQLQEFIRGGGKRLPGGWRKKPPEAQ